MVAGNQDDADPFEILEKVYDIEETLAVVVPPVPLKHGSQRTDLQESPSPLNSAEGTGYPSQKGADITLGLRRSARHLERRFTRGALLSFHDPPGQYTLAQRVGTLNLDNGAPNVVSVLRNSPQIFEEDIPDEEAEPENRDDDDAAPYSFPCEDPKINELVSKMTSLSLGTSLSISRSTVTPTRVRARVPAFTPVCAQASSVVAVLRPVESRPPTVQRATPMDVDEDVLYPKVVNKGAPHPEKILEAVLMDGVVFHPEVKDVEMSEAFATNRKLSRATLIYGFSLIPQQLELRLSPLLRLCLPAPGLPFLAHNPRSKLPGIRNLCHIKHNGPSPERYLLLRNSLVRLNVPSLIFCVNPQSPLFSVVQLPYPPLVPAVVP